MTFLNCSDPRISITGRHLLTSNNSWRFSFPGISIKTKIKGSGISARMLDFGVEQLNNHFTVLIDGLVHSVIKLSNTLQDISLFEKQDDDWHTVELFKRTESRVGECEFYGFTIDDSAALEQADEPNLLIEFIGDSITCGYGIEAKSATDNFEDFTENSWLSFAAIAARNLQARYTMISSSGKGVYRNWGSEPFADTTLSEIYVRTLADNKNVEWDFSIYKPSIVVINAGTNDFSPPHFANEPFFINAYTALINTVRTKYGNDCFIFCVNGPVLAKRLSEKHNDFVNRIVQTFNRGGDKRIFFFAMTPQNIKSGYGAQWHPSIFQSKMNGLEVAAFIKEKIGLSR